MLASKCRADLSPPARYQGKESGQNREEMLVTQRRTKFGEKERHSVVNSFFLRLSSAQVSSTFTVLSRKLSWEKRKVNVGGEKKTRLHCRTGTPKYTKRRKEKSFFSLFFLNPFSREIKVCPISPFFVGGSRASRGFGKSWKKFGKVGGKFGKRTHLFCPFSSPDSRTKGVEKGGQCPPNTRKMWGTEVRTLFQLVYLPARSGRPSSCWHERERRFPEFHRIKKKIFLSTSARRWNIFPSLSEYWTHTAAVFFPKKDRRRRREKPLPLQLYTVWKMRETRGRRGRAKNVLSGGGYSQAPKRGNIPLPPYAS